MSLRQAIDSFQFVNLIENRVPFVLLNFDASFFSVDGLAENFLHAKKIQELQKPMISPAGVAKVFPQIWKGWAKLGVRQLCDQGLDRSTALIVVCPHGKWAPIFQSELEKQGFFNSYYVEGGWRHLKTHLGKSSSTVLDASV